MGTENEGEEEITFPEVGLKVTYISEENLNYYTVRKLELHDFEVWCQIGCSSKMVTVNSLMFAV